MEKTIAFCLTNVKKWLREEGLAITGLKKEIVQNLVTLIKTRPNEFGSMTTRKDDILPFKTIKCDRKP